LRGGRLKMPFVWEAIKVWRRELRRSIAAIFPPAWQGQSGTPFFLRSKVPSFSRCAEPDQLFLSLVA
jgi:hypothetical protein